MQKLMMISLDALGDREADKLMKYPNFRTLVRKSTMVRGADTIFLSNTYPIHASVVTGQRPAVHGIISNTEAFPGKEAGWYSEAGRFRTRTLWQAVAEKGYETAAVMWPVTAGAREIAYNIPEVMAKSGENQVLTSLRAGSKRLQLKEFMKHGKKLKGIRQPYLDQFSTACMADIIKEYEPQLMLMHLTAYDFLCHSYGKYSAQADLALESLDEHLGMLLDAVGDDTAVITFSDHSQLQVHTNLTPNDQLVKMGLLKRGRGGYEETVYQCYIECCGGSAFFHPGLLSDRLIARVQAKVEAGRGFGRFLSEKEMKECGRAKLPFGFCAARGYRYGAVPGKYRADHGYPPDYDQYKVFYTVRGEGIAEDQTLQGGSVLDLAPLATEILGVSLKTRRAAREDVFIKP